MNAKNSKRLQEITDCEREAAFLERILTNNPSDTRNWVLRSEIYAHLQTLQPHVQYRAEELFFGPFVAGLSPQQTAKAAQHYSFLSHEWINRTKKVVKDLTENAEE